MPYIKSVATRRAFDHILKGLNHQTISEIGELNYLITRLISNYLGPEVNYARLNSITGMLHDVATEFDRRIVAPYEDKKAWENGDVFESIHIACRPAYIPGEE